MVSLFALRLLMLANLILRSLRIWIQPLDLRKVVVQRLLPLRLHRSLSRTILGPQYPQRILERGALLYKRIPTGLHLLPLLGVGAPLLRSIPLVRHKPLLRIKGVLVKGRLLIQPVKVKD